MNYGGIGVVDSSESAGAIDTKAALTQSRWVGLSAIFLICLVGFYADRSTFAVATDTIVNDLGITPTQIELATTLFSIGYAINYYYADGKRLGRRNIWLEHNHTHVVRGGGVGNHRDLAGSG